MFLYWLELTESNVITATIVRQSLRRNRCTRKYSRRSSVIMYNKTRCIVVIRDSVLWSLSTTSSLMYVNQCYSSLMPPFNYPHHSIAGQDTDTNTSHEPVLFHINIPYSRVIRRMLHISAYSLISAYTFPVTNTHS